MSKYLFLVLSFLFANTCFAQLDAIQIIEQNYKTTKTVDLINKIQQLEANAVFEQNNVNISVNMKGKMPDMFRTSMMIGDLELLKISQKGKTTHYNPFNDSISVKPCGNSPLMEFVKGWLAIIDTIDNTEIELVGEDKIEDIDVYQIKIDIGKLSKTYFVDKLSFLVLRIDENTGKTTLYQDYRQIENYIVPYRIAVYDEDKPNFTMQFKIINLHANIPDSEFEYIEKN